jgi:NACHT domain
MPELDKAFMAGISEALRSGEILLLIDGLDEIAGSADRVSFVMQLRTFLATYPSVRLVVTSREVGFRAVAGALESACACYRIGDLKPRDIRELTIRWHREVVGASQEVAREAERLADSIIKADRVRRLACNPLLLTTLLLVKRWVGELPRKRSVLYSKAIEVLLMTWNVEGHSPIDQEEALPQLAFVAYAMMERSIQSVSIKELHDLFAEARRQMPEVLGYARMPVNEFTQRVEERSSLLSLSGHIVEDGVLRSIYEFKHLTFQEYLAALAIAMGWYPGRVEGESPVSILDKHLKEESWREVVPLTAVLAGRDGSRNVKRLCEIVVPRPWYEQRPGGRENIEAGNLLQCLLDEVQLPPEQVREALRCFIRSGVQVRSGVDDLLLGRYAEELRRVAHEGYQEFDYDYISRFGSALATVVMTELRDGSGGTADSNEIVAKLHELMSSGELPSQMGGALGGRCSVSDSSVTG